MGLRLTSLAVAWAAALIFTGPAAAQWRYYDGYRYYPPNYPSYPQFPGGGPAYEPQPQPPGTYGEPDNGAASSYAPPQQVTPGAPASGGAQNDTQAAASPRTAQMVRNPTSEPPGTIIVDTRTRHLFYVQKDGTAIEYGIGVGREGFAWKGTARVGRKAEWPRWIPPKEMLARRPDLPSEMSGGLANPLGARALYLFQGNKDTLFRIHGTNEPDTIGKAVSSGCIRMMNADVMDLYQRVGVGTRVVVL
jgi:lipoprotein-anchoring transpeptidase ErfK/SrfK